MKMVILYFLTTHSEFRKLLYLGTLVWRNVGGGAWVGEKVVLVRYGFVSPYEFETRAKLSTNRKV